MILAFDRDGTLESFGGPIPWTTLNRLKALGCRLATAGGATATEQLRQWLEHGVIPDIALTKGDLLQVLWGTGIKIVWIDDDMSWKERAIAAGFQFVSPQEFLALGEGYFRAP